MIRAAFVLWVLLCLSRALLAQNEVYRNAIGLQSGVSLFSFFRGNLSGSTIDTTFRFSSGRATNFPQLQVAYDYGLTKWFSIGGAVSYNKVTATLNNVTYNRTENLGDVSLGVSRTTIGLRALFHYANANRLDLYSGVRLGIGIWGVSVSSSIVDDRIDPLLRSVGGKGLWRTILGRNLGVGWAALQAQLIAFGMRTYIGERIGINGELGVGSPYFMSVGVSYRFGNSQYQ